MNQTRTMGIGRLGIENFGKFRTRNKSRWVFEAEFPFAKVPSHFVKLNERPDLGPVMHDNSFPVEWDPFVTTFYEIDPESQRPLLEITNTFDQYATKPPDPILGTAKLSLFDGCGCLLEEWVYREVYPCGLRIESSDYTSDANADFEIQWKFRSCEYKNFINPLSVSASPSASPSPPETPAGAVEPKG